MNFFLFVIINYASINESIFLLYQSQLIYKVTRIRLILIHFFPMHPSPLSQCILFPKSLVFKTDKTALKNGHEEENRQSKKWRLWILWKSYSPPIRHIFWKKKKKPMYEPYDSLTTFCRKNFSVASLLINH